MVHHLELVNRNEKGILKSTFKYKSLFFPMIRSVLEFNFLHIYWGRKPIDFLFPFHYSTLLLVASMQTDISGVPIYYVECITIVLICSLSSEIFLQLCLPEWTNGVICLGYSLIFRLHKVNQATLQSATRC